MRTVLIIDDERPIRDLCRAALEAAGYVVDTAPNGAEGLRLLSPAELVAVVRSALGEDGRREGPRAD
jgi:DNA-binding response OmpR family regulator